jgi:hypothetical protein
MTRILVFGSRDWTDTFGIWAILNGYLRANTDGVTVIQGGAGGADAIAKQWAEVNGQPVETYPADWARHGKAAGPIRNQQQLDDGKPDVAWGFISKPLRLSRGSADMARRVRAAGIRCYVVEAAP